jgi:hypothetical protein
LAQKIPRNEEFLAATARPNFLLYDWVDLVVIGSKKFHETKNFWQQWPDQILSFTSNFFWEEMPKVTLREVYCYVSRHPMVLSPLSRF